VGHDFCVALILDIIEVAKVCRDDRRWLPSAEASQDGLEGNLHQPQFSSWMSRRSVILGVQSDIVKADRLS